MKITGSRKKSKLQKPKLDECQWGQEETASLNNLKDDLARITPLAHPRADWDVCLFPDARAGYWGAVATQIPPGDLEKPRGEQRHEPLAFLSGKFVGAASRWAIVEKEAFAIVEACQRLDYLLLRPGGFTIFTDHRNLIYIFNPYAVDAGIHRYQADKLQRWALGLSCFNYEIEHVAPLQQPDFEWPTSTEIRHVQDEAISLRAPDDVTLDSERDLYVTNTGKVWLPPDARDLHQRVCVIGHAGASGHRGIKATLHMIKDVFYWPTMPTDVEAFIRGCIHCLSTGNSREPRPFGPTLRATQPNEVLHFDFLSLPASSTGLQYVLVLKDGMSGYTELVECPVATADEALSALVDWFKRFGIVYQWVSDQGTHFKNQLIGSLRRLFGAQHHFVTAYCPWLNGSVEVVNRLVLKAMKALLSELKLRIMDWPSLLPVVQYSLNTMPSDRLGMVTPLTAFTGLPGSSQLRAIVRGDTIIHLSEDRLANFQQQHLKQVRGALDEMHRSRVGVAMPKFEVGDFILAASVLPCRNKLALYWYGPKRIVAAVNDYTFQVQDLVAQYGITLHHASRLKFDRDSQREVTEDLLDHVHHGAGGHVVEKLLDCRKGPDDYELKVQWVGLDPLEASWEPAHVMLEDIPKLVEAYVVAHPRHRALQAMWRDLRESVAPTQRKRGGGSDPSVLLPASDITPIRQHHSR
ncbi:hypothetical protein ON010_g16894 [Phytophthora cinnamomi]|nr:hypothetical protein ON010_g16894 [Phytophthora cinnamomi]